MSNLNSFADVDFHIYVDFLHYLIKHKSETYASREEE